MVHQYTYISWYVSCHKEDWKEIGISRLFCRTVEELHEVRNSHTKTCKKKSDTNLGTEGLRKEYNIGSLWICNNYSNFHHTSWNHCNLTPSKLVTLNTPFIWLFDKWSIIGKGKGAPVLNWLSTTS